MCVDEAYLWGDSSKGRQPFPFWFRGMNKQNFVPQIGEKNS